MCDAGKAENFIFSLTKSTKLERVTVLFFIKEGGKIKNPFSPD